jgi:hypothetical protein
MSFNKYIYEKFTTEIKSNVYDLIQKISEEYSIPIENLQQTYDTFFQIQKIRDKMRMFKISAHDIGFDYDGKKDEWADGVEEEIIIYLNKNKNKNKILKNIVDIKRGDTVRIIECNNYRNDGIVSWNGSKFIPLCYDYDGYGSVPRCYLTFTEFPVLYFHQDLDMSDINDDTKIVHNSLHNLNFKLLKPREVKERREYEDEMVDMYIYYFVYNNKEWSVGSQKKVSLNSIITAEYKHPDLPSCDFLRCEKE